VASFTLFCRADGGDLLPFGLIAPNFTRWRWSAGAITPGMASSLIGFATTGMARCSAGVIGIISTAGVLPLTLACLLSLAAFVIVLGLERPRGLCRSGGRHGLGG